MKSHFQGVTFLAFGNGAPDIFGAIASVLSSPRPKADLALGGLIGMKPNICNQDFTFHHNNHVLSHVKYLLSPSFVKYSPSFAGAAIFVTLAVHASVVLTTPFKVNSITFYSVPYLLMSSALFRHSQISALCIYFGLLSGRRFAISSSCSSPPPSFCPCSSSTMTSSSGSR